MRAWSRSWRRRVVSLVAVRRQSLVEMQEVVAGGGQLGLMTLLGAVGFLGVVVAEPCKG